MAINRWGIDVRKGTRVTCHHPRGGAVTGNVARLYTMRGYGRRIDLDIGGSFALDDVFKVHPLPAAYVTTYCNHPHRMRDGAPIGHTCYVLPREALRAEHEGDIERAVSLLQAGKPFRQHRGAKPD